MYLCLHIYGIKHIIRGEWDLGFGKKLQEIYMSRISVLQLTHLISARVAFCAHNNKKSAFLPDFSFELL